MNGTRIYSYTLKIYQQTSKSTHNIHENKCQCVCLLLVQLSDLIDGVYPCNGLAVHIFKVVCSVWLLMFVERDDIVISIVYFQTTKYGKPNKELTV
eukprot:m.162584 g.162584  ORF g.162584 m.162584 type:complete len:96 (+) comp13407_c0_seq10:40-327(+)